MPSLKQRVRLTNTGQDLIDRVNSGDSSSWDDIDIADYLWRVKNMPNHIIRTISESSPRRQHSFNTMLKKGLIEVYTDPLLDSFERGFLPPEEKEVIIPEVPEGSHLGISEKGAALMRSMVIIDLSGAPHLSELGSWLYHYSMDEDVPPWVQLELLREGYLIKVEGAEGEILCLD